MANTIKISQLPNIGNATTANTLFPVVNTNGTFTTQKVTVGNVANFALNEAGNLLPPAFLSTYSLNVINANQPNITSTGTLANITINDIANLHIPGGNDGDFISTDGNGNLSWSSAFGALANYTGNIGNLSFAYANNSVLLGNANAYIKLAGGGDTRLADDLNDVEIWSAGNVFSFNTAGSFTAPKDVSASGNLISDDLYVGNTGNIGLLTVQVPGNVKYVALTNGNINLTNNLVANGSLYSNTGVSTTGYVSVVGNVVSQANITANKFITGNGIFFANGDPYTSGAAGSNTQIQFNDNNSLGANAGFTFNKVTGNLNVPGTVIASNISTAGTITGQNVTVNGNLYVNNTLNADSIIPNGDNLYDLGSTGNRWSNIFASNIKNASGNIVISVGSESWSFTTEGNGNTYFPPNSYMTTQYGSMYVQSKGDYYVTAYDQPVGVDNQGGRIRFYAGNGSQANATTFGGEGGYIRLYAGDGGQSALTNYGGQGGYVRIIAGDGANAISTTGAVARDGGNVEIIAGNAGFNDSQPVIGANGGAISFTAGNSTLINGYGGNINLNAGTSSFGPKGTINLNGIVILEQGAEIDNSVANQLYVGDNDTFIYLVGNEAGAGFYVTTNNAAVQYQWIYDNLGGVSSPINGNSATYTKGSVTTINGDPFPSSSPQQTLQNIWSASSWEIIGAKVNLRVQAINYTEIITIDMVKEYNNANVSFNVYGRLKSNNSVNDTDISVNLDVSNNLTLFANCQALGYAYYTYDVKEYKYTYD